MTEQEKREKAIGEMREIVCDHCDIYCYDCYAMDGCKDLYDAGYRKSKKIWHDFSKEKPQENKDYVTMVLFECGGVWMSVLPYYKEAMAFNWDGEGDDTKIEVQYWAEVADVVDQAKEVDVK